MSYIPNIKDLEVVRQTINKTATKVTLQELENHYKGYKIESLEELVRFLVENEAFYTYQYMGSIFLTYASDIKFNYRDKYIFIPFTVYSNDVKTEVKEETYKKSLLKKEEVLYTNAVGDKVMHYYLYPKYDIGTCNVYLSEVEELTFYLHGKHVSVCIKDLPLTKNKAFSLEYCKQLYYNLHQHTKEDQLRYIEVDGKIAITERTLRKRLELDKYLEYNKIHYTDIGYYRHSELFGYTTNPDQPFDERLLQFEMYLYLVCNTPDIEVEEEYQQAFKNLQGVKRFLAIGTHHPLIIKWYYLNPTAFKRKSYETFKTRKD